MDRRQATDRNVRERGRAEAAKAARREWNAHCSFEATMTPSSFRWPAFAAAFVLGAVFARSAHAALAYQTVEIELVEATVDGVAVDDTPEARRTGRLSSAVEVDFGTAGRFSYTDPAVTK